MSKYADRYEAQMRAACDQHAAQSQAAYEQGDQAAWRRESNRAGEKLTIATIIVEHQLYGPGGDPARETRRDWT